MRHADVANKTKEKDTGPFEMRCDKSVFDLDETAMLEKHGRALQQLMEGTRAPSTPLQKHFVFVCKGKGKAVTVFEKVWLKYLQRVEYEVRHANSSSKPLRKIVKGVIQTRQDARKAKTSPRQDTSRSLCSICKTPISTQMSSTKQICGRCNDETRSVTDAETKKQISEQLRTERKLSQIRKEVGEQLKKETERKRRLVKKVEEYGIKERERKENRPPKIQEKQVAQVSYHPHYKKEPGYDIPEFEEGFPRSEFGTRSEYKKMRGSQYGDLKKRQRGD
jgi:uncharacterized protein